MEIRSQRSAGWFYIDWWLTNYCSWRCSYCPDILRSGSIPRVEIKDCQRFLDQAHAHAQKRSQKLNITLTGGEITEWIHLIDLLKSARSLDVFLTIRTNANLSAEQWGEIVENVSSVELLYHFGWTQHSRFLMNLARTIDAGVDSRVVIMMLPDRFSELSMIADEIENRYRISVERKVLFEDTAFNRKPLGYNESQTQELKYQKKNIDDERYSQETDYQTMVLENINCFQEMQCWAGIEQIIVDAWGKVFRSHCRQDGAIGHISGDIRWPTEPTICRKDRCVNAFDILSTKKSI